MNTPAHDHDLSKQSPHSPRERLAGFVIANRTIDKCLASMSDTLGEYHYDCPLDNLLFSFKGIDGAQFKTAVQEAKTYADMGEWLQSHGTPKTPAEIKTWSDDMDKWSPMKTPEKRSYFIESCARLGLNPEMNTQFDLLEADDRSAFRRKPAGPELVSSGAANK